MRMIARISCVMALAALAAPSAVEAQHPSHGRPVASAVAKPKRSLFGRGAVCADCQRAAAMAKGAAVPPPPPLPGVMAPGHSCSACGNDRAVVSSVGPMNFAEAAQGQPNYDTGEAPGYASTDGGPAPLGTSAPHMMAGAPAPAGGGPRDPSVAMSGYSPTPVIPLGANRPRILSNLIGIPDLGRGWRESRFRRREEAHAMTRFGTDAPVITDLPASAVYGR